METNKGSDGTRNFKGFQFALNLRSRILDKIQAQTRLVCALRIYPSANHLNEKKIKLVALGL